jgi:hypothetical protein
MWGKVVPIIFFGAGLATLVSSSGIMGDNPLKVQEPIEIHEVGVTSIGGGESNGVIFNDNLSFAVTAETYPGGSYDIRLRLNNLSEVDQNHRLVFDVPDGFRLSRSTSAQGDNITLVQQGPRSFVYTVDTVADGTTADDDLVVHVEVLPQMFPGWYSLSAASVPLATNLSNP